MEGVSRSLLQAANQSGDTTGELGSKRPRLLSNCSLTCSLHPAPS